MTTEKIAELRQRYKAVTKGSAAIRAVEGTAFLVHPDLFPLALDALRALPLILNEREALLEALKRYGHHEHPEYVPFFCPCGLADAIARAEAPA